MDLVSYQGNCHCGSHRFRITTPKIETVQSCSCEICYKIGYLIVEVPKEHFEFTRNVQTLAVYSSATGSHKFCQTCGTGLFVEHVSARDDDVLTLNVRSLIGVNPFSLTIDGLTHDASDVEKPSAELHAQPLRSLSNQGEAENQYTGRCLCESVTLTVTARPLSLMEIKEDNCSICVRNAFIGIYPSKSAVFIQGREQTRDYTFGRKFNGHPFCKTCGTHVFMNLHGPPKEIVDGWPLAKQEFVKKMLDIQPVNMRSLIGVDMAELEVVRNDEGTQGYALEDL